MRLMALRRIARQYAGHLNRTQRRRWLEQRATLTPKVGIGSMPESWSRQYVYTSQARTK